jgi:hypothetical protein
MSKFTQQIRQIIADTDSVRPEAKADLAARLVAILDAVGRLTTPTSVEVIPVPEQANAIGLKIQFVQPAGQPRSPILSVVTRYLPEGPERGLLRADTTIWLFRGDGASDRQVLHHARAAEQVLTYLGLGL